MPFTATELANIAASSLDVFLDRGKVLAQNLQSKPLVAAFEANAGTFPGGKGKVSTAVKSGQGGGNLQGYTHDDLVNYYNPAGTQRAEYPWKEHHIGLGITHTELKHDGITVIEDGADQRTVEKDGREEVALANMLDEKLETMAEDYAVEWDALLHGDGTGDAKALTGLGAILLAAPATGTTGGISRVTNAWWRNRAATAANGLAGGQGAITSSAADGGALITFLQKESRQLNRFANGGTRRRHFAGSDFIAAYEGELRANGSYTMNGFQGTQTGDMGGITWMGKPIEYDPTLDDMGLSKRMMTIDFRRIRLMYMQGEKMKRHNPARPYDRYVHYRAITTTAVLVASQLNTSAVYDIA